MKDQESATQRENKGLKRLRRASAKEPTFSCDNCKCNRYSPCTCQRKKKK